MSHNASMRVLRAILYLYLIGVGVVFLFLLGSCTNVVTFTEELEESPREHDILIEWIEVAPEETLMSFMEESQ